MVYGDSGKVTYARLRIWSVDVKKRTPEGEVFPCFHTSLIGGGRSVGKRFWLSNVYGVEGQSTLLIRHTTHKR